MKKMSFRIGFFSFIVPIIWLLVALTWILNCIRFGGDSLKIINIILASSASIGWFIKLLWLKKTPYLEFNPMGIKINVSMLAKKNLLWSSIEQINIKEKKYLLHQKIQK